MNFIRASLCDPRLTNRQQKMLTAILSYMPFESDEGWTLGSTQLCRDVYFGKEPTATAKRHARATIKELEDLGFISRIYADRCIGMQGDPTVFVNWNRLREPYKGEVHHGPQSGPPRTSSPISTHKYQGTVDLEDMKLRVVK